MNHGKYVFSQLVECLRQCVFDVQTFELLVINTNQGLKKEIKLVKIYSLICERFEKDLKFTCQRFSNYNEQDLTDQIIVTIYLFETLEEQRF